VTGAGVKNFFCTAARDLGQRRRSERELIFTLSSGGGRLIQLDIGTLAFNSDDPVLSFRIRQRTYTISKPRSWLRHAGGHEEWIVDFAALPSCSGNTVSWFKLREVIGTLP